MLRGSVFFFLTCSVLLCGCGTSHPPTFPVYGKVMFPDDEPVRIGTVEFRQEGAGQDGNRAIARGTIQEDGTFQLSTFNPNDGALAGTHQVTVHQLIIVEDQSFASHGHGRRVSPKYSDYATSGLKADVKAVPSSDKSTNQITLRLQVDAADRKGNKPK
ncbi:MAG: hypothetical protein U0905_00965 [Pirellulales bacterium]